MATRKKTAPEKVSTEEVKPVGEGATPVNKPSGENTSKIKTNLKVAKGTSFKLVK